MARPRLNREGEQELDKIDSQMDAFQDETKSITLDETRSAPKHEMEPQTKLAQSEIDKTKDLYLKPKRTIGPGVNPKTGEREKFNEKFRDEYNQKKQYVQFIAENNEIIGESADFWVKKFPGTNLEEWLVPVNKPVWAPLYVKERLEECGYTVFKSTQSKVSHEGISYDGYLEVQERKNRLDAREVSKKRNIYMGNVSY